METWNMKRAKSWYLPHQKEPYKHSNHDRSSNFLYYNDQVPEQYNKQLLHACPTEVAAYPL